LSELQIFTNRVNQSNFDAALNYLTLFWDEKQAVARIRALRRNGVVERRANDIVRASGGVPWGWDDPGVKRGLLKALSGKRLHPPLLVTHDEGLIIADGSHRVSLAYHLDPFMNIPVLLAS